MEKFCKLRTRRILTLSIFLCLILFQVASSYAQDCPALINPINGETGVELNTTISWEAIAGVPGYILSIGTTEGGTDVLNELNVGASTTYTADLGLPENTELFVTITLFFFNENQPDIVCDSQSFTTATLTNPPDCTIVRIPTENAINVNTATNIFWSFAPNATGYFINIGTTPGGSDIVNNRDLGNNLSFNPLVDLPAESEIYLTVTPYNRIGQAPNCNEIMFTTAADAPPPDCTQMISPFNGETNIPLSPILEWAVVPNASGYIVSIGTSPFDNNVLDQVRINSTTTNIIDFEPNRTFFITVIPFNAAGEAIGCMQETFSTIQGCGPFFDPNTGELVTLNPELSFPDIVSICLDRDENIISATDNLDGFRWYKIDLSGNESLISSNDEVNITEAGEYRYEGYYNIEDSGLFFECATSKIFRVEESEAATISNVSVTRVDQGITIETTVTGIGNYEFALDNENGPYQQSNTFLNASLENHVVYVRDINGCGITQELIEQDFDVEGFPNFFTPNGDGANDFWQFIPPAANNDQTILSIFIYDRYGTLLAQIDPNSKGWYGNFNGNRLPESTYWFKAISTSNKVITGFFSLKR